MIKLNKILFYLIKRDNNFEIELKIDDMETQMYSIEEKSSIIIPIVRKINNYDYTEKPLFHIHFEK